MIIPFMTVFLDGHEESAKSEIGDAQDCFMMGLAAKMRNKERWTPIRRGPWIADESRLASAHRHLMGFGGSESAAP
jgi:hypothetical protein